VTRGKLEVDGECMNSDFCAAVVKQAIDEASRAEQWTPITKQV
jgi:hypothetical protein